MWNDSMRFVRHVVLTGLIKNGSVPSNWCDGCSTDEFDGKIFESVEISWKEMQKQAYI